MIPVCLLYIGVGGRSSNRFEWLLQEKEIARAMNGRRDSVFERNKTKVRVILVVVLVFAGIVCGEISLRRLMGMGNPVLYDSSPLYGYRPLPNRSYHRFRNAHLRFNNLRLRAEKDWDADPNNKVLFLGDSVTFGGSYIDNQELFSHLAVQDLSNYESGNAGVNAWGVENIYGLVVESRFLPARIYVTTLPEGDFYRGLTRCQGTPFYNVSPRFALLELWYYFCFKQNIHRYREWQAYASTDERRFVVEKAVQRLKEMDESLRRAGFDHLMFITPSKEQVTGKAQQDPLVKELLEKHGLHPVYIADKLNELGLSLTERERLFYDLIHLDRQGHVIWAKIIRRELEKVIPPQSRDRLGNITLPTSEGGIVSHGDVRQPERGCAAMKLARVTPVAHG